MDDKPDCKQPLQLQLLGEPQEMILCIWEFTIGTIFTKKSPYAPTLSVHQLPLILIVKWDEGVHLPLKPLNKACIYNYKDFSFYKTKHGMPCMLYIEMIIFVDIGQSSCCATYFDASITIIKQKPWLSKEVKMHSSPSGLLIPMPNATYNIMKDVGKVHNKLTTNKCITTTNIHTVPTITCNLLLLHLHHEIWNKRQ